MQVWKNKPVLLVSILVTFVACDIMVNRNTGSKAVTKIAVQDGKLRVEGSNLEYVKDVEIQTISTGEQYRLVIADQSKELIQANAATAIRLAIGAGYRLLLTDSEASSYAIEFTLSNGSVTPAMLDRTYMELGGGTATGALILPLNGLTVGTSQIVTSSGNVGIGTTSPGSSLDVKGTLRLSGSTSGYVGLAPAASAGSTTYTLPSSDGDVGQTLRTDGSGALSWASVATIAGSARGLFVKTNTSTPTTTIDVTATELILQNASGDPYRITSVSVSPVITSSGANGLDTGSEASSTWYYIWVIHNGTSAAGLLSTSATSPTLPGGYTYRAMVGAVYNDSSSNFVKFHQRGRKTFYNAYVTALSVGTATSYTSVSLLVPPAATTALVHHYCFQPTGGSDASNDHNCYLSFDGTNDFVFGSALYYAPGYWNAWRTANTLEIPLATAQTVYYKVNNDAVNTYLYTMGFIIE